MLFANEIKDLLSFPKLYLVFLKRLSVLEKTILEEKSFLAHFGNLCSPVVVLVFEKNVLKKKNEECFEEKIDTNLYGYKSP
jgi:hypothetical protein